MCVLNSKTPKILITNTKTPKILIKYFKHIVLIWIGQIAQSVQAPPNDNKT